AATAPGALDGVAAVWEQAVARLAAWPATFLHGEFYASNILVADGGAVCVRPVDWEMAGVGPGVLDLAALVAGGWSAEDRERMVRAYHDALPAGDRPAWPELVDALAHARLHVAVQWLGWSPGWTAPADHAHDWLGEARALAAELAR
ncbi:MAG TPA: phosphotransferase, partial [Baekduia sp.]|nr:phosphotransferase [Baekduia sp.]